MDEQKPFREWAIVELFGHTTIAGQVSSQVIGTCSFVRIDVPEINGQPAYTRIYGEKAIYSIQPVTEEVARKAATHLLVVPINVWYLKEPSTKQIEGPEDVSIDEDGVNDDFFS
jgi:hypothetical protein